MMRMSLVIAVVFFGFIVHGSSAAFNPVDSFLIACGSSQNVSFQGRTFVLDSFQSSFLLKSEGDTVISATDSSAPSPIYRSLRIFTKPSSYEFDIRQKGRHWVRLYFHPLLNSGHNLSSAPLTVVTENFVLLNNFTFKNQNQSYLFKEYIVNVMSDSLSINFVPSNNSITFVNAIGVVSVPDDLIPDQALDLSPTTPFSGLSEVALQTVYRLNMGGPLLTPQNDTLGRTWENDVKYLHVNSSAVNVSASPGTIKYPPGVTAETAPNLVYATAEAMGNPNVANSNFNVTWVFSVDPSFIYFVRLHFCDIVSTAMNDLVFNVYINSDLAIASLDLSSKTGGLAVPYYKDFISNSSTNSSTMYVSVGPDVMADTMNAILNGLEIMKISNGAGSLDGPSPVDGFLLKSRSKKSKTGIVIGSVVGAAVAMGFMALCWWCFMARKSKASTHPSHPWLSLPLYGNSQTMTKGSTISQKSGTASCVSLASTNLGRLFTFQEIMDATNKFDESLLLGVGGFGKVYKGTLDDGTYVAIKRGNPRSEQGLAEFHTEIEMLSKLRHRHLVSLIGYCDERSEMVLVYEYMANGPLRSHLYGTELPSLSWKQRLEICIGAARGLHYLHTGAAQSIIHRDVKTTNILLDENFVAKVADFGLSKTGPSLDQTHVSTAVKGSFGYLDPEYFRRQQLTEKSDVYSFGVVLMEVLCSRPALNPVLPREQVNIAEWAMTWQKKGMLDHIMDPALVGKISPASLRKFGETAEKCLAEQGVDRPTMGDVLWNLEYALQLEETSSALTDIDENSTNHIADIPLQPFDNSVNMIDVVHSGTDGDVEDVTTSAVFSQLVNPRGSGGGYAEKVAVPAGQVLPIPPGVSLKDAASFPEVACTVWSTVFMMSRLSTGETFLIHGGSSGIGTFAIQIAKHQGARVFVTAGSEEKLAFCKDLGADVCINYKTEDFVARVKEETGGKGVDVILDNVGGPYFQQNLNGLNVDGRLFIIGFLGGVATEVNLSSLLVRRLTVQAAGLRSRSLENKAVIVSEVEKNVWPAIAAGKVKPMVYKSFPLAKAAEAHGLMESSKHIGKILLIP